jgi:Uma2 family endonuclease
MVATAPAVNTPVQHIVLEHVSWETYESLLADYADQSAPRFTYDQGKLEIVSPLTTHEEDNRTLAMAVEVIAETWSVNLRNIGSMTFKREDLLRGFEPDTGFYIQREEQVRNRKQIHLAVDPPPDLVIEIEVTNAAIPKLPLYAEVGIPEVWRISGDRVTILRLESGEYHEGAVSVALPPIDNEIVSRFLQDSRRLLRVDWIRAVRAWARDQVSI